MIPAFSLMWIGALTCNNFASQGSNIMRLTMLTLMTGLLIGMAIAQFFGSLPFWLWLIVLPLVAVGLNDALQIRHSLRRNYPLLGRLRWLMEKLRPFVRQYFIESDTDGTPINRMYRDLVYQRAKTARESVAFGSHLDSYANGYEWLGHSLGALAVEDVGELRVTIGGPHCSQPFSASIFNISAMSFGAISPHAILAMNMGARIGHFAQNTGEGGISKYHLVHGGDLIWQIGTGYFGCRDPQGGFDAARFSENAALDVVKMIEIKLSQGAKPGHGGILPAEKNSVEIATARGVEPHTQVDSPPLHSAFGTPLELMHFIARLRELSGGKPVGIKLAIGRESEFIAICKAMVETGASPDFITVDGGEGGTGTAPLEYANSVGMPLREALALVDDCLRGFALREHVKVIASGKIFSAFHLVKHLALGADLCSSARGMMLAAGCVHSLTCNSNHCPSGVATQNPALYRGLVVENKGPRVARYHARTLHATAELISSAGLPHTAELNRTHIYRRVNQREVMRYDQIFPYVEAGALLRAEPPARFAPHLQEADMQQFRPRQCVALLASSGAATYNASLSPSPPS